MARRWRATLGVVVALAIAGGGAAYVLGRPDTGPAPATKKAIAAVTVDVLGISPSSFEVNPYWDDPLPLGVEIRWHPDGSHDAHSLTVQVTEGRSRADLSRCVDAECATWRHGDGTMYLSWQKEAPEEDPGTLTLTYRTAGGEARQVTYSGQPIHQDPRDQSDLPESVADLERLLTDPRLSATTTRQMVDADLAKWPKGEAARAGDEVATTPRIVAGWMYEELGREPKSAHPADTSAYGKGAVGAVFEDPGVVTTVVIVPADGGRAPACRAGWHCSKPREGDIGRQTGEIVTGWKPGEARVYLTLRDRTVLGIVRSPLIDAEPRASSKYGKAGQDVAALRNTSATWGLVTTRAFRDDSRFDWFRD